MTISIRLYHLHSSDHPDLVLVGEPLNGNNYGVWIIAMKTSLEAKNKFGSDEEIYMRLSSEYASRKGDKLPENTV